MDAAAGLATILAGPMPVDSAQDVLRAVELASDLGLPAVYDAHYLALAERMGCELWTADERLWNSVRTSLSWVRWIGEA